MAREFKRRYDDNFFCTQRQNALRYIKKKIIIISRDKNFYELGVEVRSRVKGSAVNHREGEKRNIKGACLPKRVKKILRDWGKRKARWIGSKWVKKG